MLIWGGDFGEKIPPRERAQSTGKRNRIDCRGKFNCIKAAKGATILANRGRGKIKRGRGKGTREKGFPSFILGVKNS